MKLARYAILQVDTIFMRFLAITSLLALAHSSECAQAHTHPTADVPN